MALLQSELEFILLESSYYWHPLRFETEKRQKILKDTQGEQPTASSEEPITNQMRMASHALLLNM